MDKQTVSFRLDAATLRDLDALADSLDRDRTYLLNEAVSAYLDVQRWHVEQIKAGLREANIGRLIDHREIRKRVRRWRRR